MSANDTFGDNLFLVLQNDRSGFGIPGNKGAYQVEQLGNIEHLIIDLRGNTGGGVGALRVMSLLIPKQIPVGFALDRKAA